MEKLKQVLKPYILCLIVFLTFTIASSDKNKPQSHKILEGDNLLIICNATEEVNSKIFWTKNETRSKFFEDGKKLEILNINKMDSGDYVCYKTVNVSLPNGNEAEANVTVEVINIDVQYAAMVPYFNLWPTEPKENGSFTISCGMMGNPGPIWSIRDRDNGFYLFSGSLPGNATLGPNKAVCYYSGYWECTGYNDLNHGVNATKGQQLNIICSPRPDPNENFETILHSPIGGVVSFYMIFYGYPKPNVTWSRDDGRPIRGVKSVDTTTSRGFASLNMSDIQFDDFGNYTLSMSNSIGLYNVHYQLIGKGAPQTPTDLHFSNVTAHSVTLSWTSGYDMGSEQFFVVMQLIGNQFIQISDRIYDKNNGVGNNLTYTHDNLDSGTYYTLTVVAQNHDAVSGFTKPYAEFDTLAGPPKASMSKSTKLAIGLPIGCLAFIALLAGMLYFMKYRGKRTSYVKA